MGSSLPNPPLVAIVAPAADHAGLAAALLADGLGLCPCVESAEALERAGGRFDLAVLVADLRQARSAAVVRRLRERGGVDRVVLVRPSADGHALRRALEAGVDGIVCADDVGSALGPTVRAVLAGQLAVPGAMRARLAPPALSHRERQVLALVVEGCTNAEIGQRLFLAESTIKSHLATAFSKLGVRSRRDAAAMILGAETLAAAILAPGARPVARGARVRAVAGAG
jgi:DNA-binding NarL/FixJ family response regulator